MKTNFQEYKSSYVISITKKIFFALLAFCAISITSHAQETSKLSYLLTEYYNIKNALVKGDAASATASATDFSTAIQAVDMNALSSTDMNAFMPLQNKLSGEADKIATSKSLQAQRENFATLSTDFFALAKSVKFSSQPVYALYCPMKKSYWLSGDKTVKNPYFGSAMLGCGSITETLNQ